MLKVRITGGMEGREEGFRCISYVGSMEVGIRMFEARVLRRFARSGVTDREV